MESGLLLIVGLALRFVGASVCTNKEKELNCSTCGWGIFVFLIAIIAIIWIQFMNLVIVSVTNVDIEKEKT